MTGINVENFTIKEVKAFGIKKLDVLMEEYYVPEFAEDEKAAYVALILFCYIRSNPQPLVSVTNKKLLGKIDRSFPDRIKI